MSFERCKFYDNALVEGSLQMFAGDGIRLRGCEIEMDGFDEFWGDGVVDLGGNKLT